jgi:hypothetical protein
LVCARLLCVGRLDDVAVQALAWQGAGLEGGFGVFRARQRNFGAKS